MFGLSRRQSEAKKHLSRKHRNHRFEQLEMREMLSAVGLEDITVEPLISGPYRPVDAAKAYGMNKIVLPSGIVGDGAGQTIAIITAYDNPNIAADLAKFDAQFGLPAPPAFKKVNQNGATNKMPKGNVGWALETALDVEWAHATAPKANILLVEANSASLSDLMTAVNYARKASLNGAPVTVVSMSWGSSEFSYQTYYDTYFTTPANHAAVTFIAASGDNGSPATWPATSSNVLAVGGTTLNTDASGNYVSETAWSGSGGGISSYEGIPSYQTSAGISTTNRGRVTPDVSLNSDPNTGYYVYDTYGANGQSGWWMVGGTSAAAPQWAGLVAIANQGTTAAGLGSLKQVNSYLYSIYSNPTTRSHFHDIVSGSNGGFYAGLGFDAVTGLGTPIVNLIINDLVTMAGGSAAKAATSTSTSTALASRSRTVSNPTFKRIFLLAPGQTSEIGAAMDAIASAASDVSTARIGPLSTTRDLASLDPVATGFDAATRMNANSVAGVFAAPSWSERLVAGTPVHTSEAIEQRLIGITSDPAAREGRTGPRNAATSAPQDRGEGVIVPGPARTGGDSIAPTENAPARVEPNDADDADSEQTDDSSSPASKGEQSSDVTPSWQAAALVFAWFATRAQDEPDNHRVRVRSVRPSPRRR